ncbi:TMV resistance protein N, partial [Mucuna pruriens]
MESVEGAATVESECRYDVYLNFRGETRNGFTGYLYNALRQKRFRTFMNNDGMQSGDQASPALLKAIEQSRISIVVFSPRYAFYTWCLEELVKIVECMNTKKQLVLPIFYRVAPFNVRKLKKHYGEAMAVHENKYGKDSDKVRKWKSALSQVAELPGLPVNGPGYEYNNIDKIVKNVTEWLPRYDIFLSFRGEDTRYSFTGFLNHALQREGFRTFMDDEGLEGGDQISSTLIKAIETSRLSIVVLSENYAYSSWCLDELVNILECMKAKNRLVWPIFYKVEPSTVRYQRKSFGEAMAAHGRKYGNDSDKVLKWKSALVEVANLKGWPLKADQYECELIENVVKTAIDNDNGNHLPIPSSSCSQEVIDNDNENHFSMSSPISSQKSIDYGNEDCFSITSPSSSQKTIDSEDYASISSPSSIVD